MTVPACIRNQPAGCVEFELELQASALNVFDLDMADPGIQELTKLREGFGNDPLGMDFPKT